MQFARIGIVRNDIDAEFNAAFDASARNVREFARQHHLNQAEEAECLQAVRDRLTRWKEDQKWGRS
ncbi:hypothetical protein [Tardiphaga sp. 285_C5_N1_2]|uniref:hypothetical protein n=1 Tax=Tardiphaga sp. 285_C5_N1_2 TaxID=3240775 RepID=UPI003F89E75A